MDNPSILHWTNLLIIPGLLLGFIIHDLGHALMAYQLGDTSQVEQGQISLNPFKHIAWLGLGLFLLVGFGWPRPLRLNPYNFKRGYLDVCLVALSGPAASLTFGLGIFMVTLTIAAAVVYASGVPTDQVLAYFFRIDGNLPLTLNLQAVSIALTGQVIKASLTLTVVSLLPLPGLDGFVVLACLVALFRKSSLPQTIRRVQPQDVYHPILLSELPRRRLNTANLHFKAGAEYHEAGQYEDAIARYQQAIKTDPRFGPAYVNLGLAYLAKSDRKKAIQSFKGATQYADDKKSQQEAWQQLHYLSQAFSPNEVETAEKIIEQGAAPWTDTQLRPNWLGLGLASLALLIGAVGVYGYLLAQLINLFKT
jgi:tetratricopeptide (TPR) repeat protein